MGASTIFLSRLIGLAALVLGMVMLVATPPMVAAVELAADDRGMLYVLAVAGVIAGLAIVLTHNVWTQGVWPLVVTLCGWLILIRGVLALILPVGLLLGLSSAARYSDYYYLYAMFPLLLGAYLTLRGFTAPRR